MTEQEKNEWLENNVKVTFLTESEINELLDNSNTITVEMNDMDEWLIWSNEELKNNIE